MAVTQKKMMVGKKGPPKKSGDEKKRVALLREIKGKPQKFKTPEDRFAFLVQKGATWHEAVADSGISPVEASKIIDQLMEFRRDGVAIFLLSERYLKEAFEGMFELARNSADDKVRMVAYGKIAEISLKVLGKKDWIQKMQLAPLSQCADEYEASTWDAAFEKED